MARESGLLRVRHPLSRVRRLVREYRTVLFWLLTDAFRNFPWQVVTIGVAAFTGAIMQGAALAAGLYYVYLLEDDHTLEYAGYELAARDPATLTLVAFGLAVVLALSAVINFYGNYLTAWLVAAYHKLASGRIIELFGVTMPRDENGRVPDKVELGLKQMQSGPAQRTAKMLRFFSRSLRSIVIAAYSIPLLLWLDARMVGILALVGLAFAPLFYRDNIQAAMSTMQQQRAAPRARNRFGRLIRMTRPWRDLTGEQQEYVQHSLSIGGLKKERDAFRKWLIARARVEMWVFFILAIGLALVLYIMGREALEGILPWAVLIGFVIFLRLAMTSLADIMRTLARFSRFFPFISQYYAVVEATRLPDEPPGAPVVVAAEPEGVVEEAAVDREQDGEAPSMRLAPGSRLALFTPFTVDRFHFPYAAGPVLQAEGGLRIPPRNCVFLGRAGLFRKAGSMREVLRLPESVDWGELQNRLHPESAAAVGEHLGTELDQPHTAGDWKGLPAALRLEMSLAAAAWVDARILVVGRRTLSALDAEHREALLERLAHLLVVVKYAPRQLGREERPAYGEPHSAVMANTGRVVALGSSQWISGQAKAIRERLEQEENKQARRRAAAAQMDGDEDEEEDSML